MWVFLNNSFLSIVENRNNKEELLVRSRIKGDIEKVFPDSNVFEMENSDYKYRSFIKKTDVSSKLKKIVENINYDNFKNSISPDQSERHNSYLNVWTELRKLQKWKNYYWYWSGVGYVNRWSTKKFDKKDCCKIESFNVLFLSLRWIKSEE